MSTVQVDGAAIEYTETGAGSPVVFVHGAYVTGALWDEVAHLLSDTHRCIVPTWPFPQLALGDADDIFPLSHARRLADAFPKAALQPIAGASTYVMLDRPEQAASAIRQFLDS
ncbi:alpha/beta fold hydrolase [Mycolicibacterium porcinum]|uniref:Alpha/beta hydrolase n=1 Tax=Mycolicibacterium porcinum TaxID=39693 RepID=A0AAW5T0A6_9MYCO|nr:hypothetical protein [Mycolicibacterium porcinum]MCV7388151.1 hypothetical protein [Mycolicibacterium porcinum]CDO31164.1 alpha/beta hydrolase fold protein [Mycolicibacterium vulneris]